MKERYVIKQYDDGTSEIFDSFKGDFLHVNIYINNNIQTVSDMLEFCDKLNQDDKHIRMSEQTMQVAGIKGAGVNLCNEFNFIDLWEVVEWVNRNENHYDMYKDFAEWWTYESNLFDMTQREMQIAIVNKIYELMKDAELIK